MYAKSDLHALVRIQDPIELAHIKWQDFHNIALNDQLIEHLLTVAGALWRHEHDGLTDEELRVLKHLKPHAGLSAGGCSTGYLDSVKALKYTPLQMLIAQEHVRRIRTVYKGPIHWVVGSDHAAATYSSFVALCLEAKHDFTEKALVGDQERQLWRRHSIAEGEVVLQCEELSTTGSTPKRVARGVQESCDFPVNWAPLYAFAINRIGSSEYLGKPIVSVSTFNMQTWASPDVCPLCNSGSKRIGKPKLEWQKLVA
jgi:hypothetical protein